MTTTPTAQAGLPELPEPFYFASMAYDGHVNHTPYHTADQMRDYALAAVRAAQAAQLAPEPLSSSDIETLAHRMASTYTHRTDPTSHAYGFITHTLIDFARAIEADILGKLYD